MGRTCAAPRLFIDILSVGPDEYLLLAASARGGEITSVGPRSQDLGLRGRRGCAPVLVYTILNVEYLGDRGFPVRKGPGTPPPGPNFGEKVFRLLDFRLWSGDSHGQIIRKAPRQSLKKHVQPAR